LPSLPYACDALQHDIDARTRRYIILNHQTYTDNYAAVEKCSKNTRKGHCKILSTIDQVPADQKCKYNNVTHTICGRVYCLEYTVVKLCKIYK
jgi:hypothetical protein